MGTARRWAAVVVAAAWEAEDLEGVVAWAAAASAAAASAAAAAAARAEEERVVGVTAAGTEWGSRVWEAHHKAVAEVAGWAVVE